VFTAPVSPFVSPPGFAAFTPPATFIGVNGQSSNSLEWVERSAHGIIVIALRHQPTLFDSVAQYGAEQERLAKGNVSTLDGFTNYTLLADRSMMICAGKPSPGWYTEVRGRYHGALAITEQLAFLQDGTLYSIDDLRQDGVPDDAATLAALHSFCPRPPMAESISPGYIEAQWIGRHVSPGMTSDQATQILNDHGLKVTSLVRKTTCFGPDIVTYWWWQTYPESECADKQQANRPVLSVELTLSSQPGCVFTIAVDMLFDERRRVEQLVLNNPVPDCL
jgi:hypothetical protein